MSAGAIETQPAPPLTRAGRALGLLAAEGASVALALWFVGARGRLPTYVYNNTLPAGSRKLLVGAAVRGRAGRRGLGLGVWIARRAAGLDAIERVAHRLAPALPGGLRAAAVSLAAVDGPARALVRGAGVGLRPVAAGADARRPGDAAVAARAPATADCAAFRRDLAGALARLPWLPTAVVGDRGAPLRPLLLDHHDPEPLQPADVRLRPRHREQPGLERGALERTAVQDVGARRRPDRRRTSAFTRRTSRI